MRHVAICAVVHGDRILMIQRGPDEGRWAGCWCLPGGKIERGETEKEAACRELREETGLVEGVNVTLIPGVTLVSNDDGDIMFHLFEFYAHELREVRIESSFIGQGWFQPDEFIGLDAMEPAPDRAQKSVDFVRQYLRKR